MQWTIAVDRSILWTGSSISVRDLVAFAVHCSMTRLTLWYLKTVTGKFKKMYNDIWRILAAISNITTIHNPSSMALHLHHIELECIGMFGDHVALLIFVQFYYILFNMTLKQNITYAIMHTLPKHHMLVRAWQRAGMALIVCSCWIWSHCTMSMIRFHSVKWVMTSDFY